MKDLNMSNTNEIVMAEAIDMSTVKHFVDQFNGFQRKSAESVIDMGMVVHQAKQLPDAGFAEFCKGIRYDSKSKALVKFKRIGEKADVLRQHVDVLPNSWTTIYILTQLADDDLRRFADEGKLQPSMMVRDAQMLVDIAQGKDQSSQKNQPTPKQTVAADEGYRFTLRFCQTPTVELVRLLQKMVDEYKQQYSIDAEVSLSDDLQEVVQQETVQEGGE